MATRAVFPGGPPFDGLTVGVQDAPNPATGIGIGIGIGIGGIFTVYGSA